VPYLTGDSRCRPTELDCLRNLRELRADGNKIRSVDGLQKLESLVKLSLQSNQIRNVDLTGFRWCVECLVTGSNWADDMLQAKIGNAKPESESAGQHPGAEDARGIDRFESRYAGTGLVPSNSLLPPLARLVSIDDWSAINRRLRRGLPHFDAAIAMIHPRH